MSKDYAKFVPRRSRASQQKKHRIIAISVLLIVFSVTAAVMLHNPGVISKMISFAKAKKISPTTVTTLVTNATNNGPPPVHFDFYEALPNMQMPVAVNLSNKPTVVELKPIISTPKPIAINSPLKTSIFNPAEVTDLLASDIGQRYSVQLGTFETEAAAKRLSAAINSLGFQLRVVKVHSEGHNSYHVQQGPFATLESAKALQLRLQKRGITSILKKA